jgi:hypothetical protein
VSIEQIEKKAQRYARAREELAELIAQMRAEQDEVKRRYMTPIRRTVAKAKERRESLYTEVEVSPDLFTKPKSRILHGIRVGWRKAKGKLTFPDAAKLIAKIKQVVPPGEQERLIKVEEKPVRAELNKLDAGTLKKLGVEVTADQDVPIVEPTDTEVDRIVDALIDDEDVEEAA